MVAVSQASYILICVDGTWQQAMEMFKVMLRKLCTSQACQGAELSHAQPCRYGVTAWSQLLNLLLPQAAQAKELHKFDFIQRVQLQCSRWVSKSCLQQAGDCRQICLSASCSLEAEQTDCQNVLQRCILREPAPQCLTTLEAVAR